MTTRTLVLCDELNAESAKQFLEDFASLNTSRGPITVQICSQGGWTAAGFAIYDAIVCSPNPVTTVGIGTVGSMAVLVLQAGKTRILAPNTFVFLHPMYIEGAWEVHNLRTYALDLERTQLQYMELIHQRSSVSLEKIKSLCSKDTFLTAPDAVMLGLADKLLVRTPFHKTKRKAKKTS